MYSFCKRLFDILLSLLIIMVLSPIIILIILILSLTGEREVFYLQDRVGFANKRFKIIKFATMLKNSPNMGTGSLTLRRDPRVLPFGHFLRITKINELPQLFNVLSGDMSFVGPRPLMPIDFEAYQDQYKKEIYNSRPGITGIGSIIFRDEQKLITASSLPPQEFYKKFILPEKGLVEMWYQKHKSIYTDLMILLLTALVIIAPNSKVHYKVFPDLPRFTEGTISTSAV